MKTLKSYGRGGRDPEYDYDSYRDTRPEPDFFHRSSLAYSGWVVPSKDGKK